MKTVTKKRAKQLKAVPQTVLDLDAMHKDLAKRLKDQDIRVRVAPEAYEEIDDLPGLPSHPTFFEEAVVLHVMDMPPHAWEPVSGRWRRKPGKTAWRTFRVTATGMLSEVYPDGRVDNMLLVRDAGLVEKFVRSIPPVSADRKTGIKAAKEVHA